MVGVMDASISSTPLQQEGKRKRQHKDNDETTTEDTPKRKKSRKKMYRPKVIGEGKRRKKVIAKTTSPVASSPKPKKAAKTRKTPKTPTPTTPPTPTPTTPPINQPARTEDSDLESENVEIDDDGKVTEDSESENVGAGRCGRDLVLVGEDDHSKSNSIVIHRAAADLAFTKRLGGWLGRSTTGLMTSSSHIAPLLEWHTRKRSTLWARPRPTKTTHTKRPKNLLLFPLPFPFFFTKRSKRTPRLRNCNLLSLNAHSKQFFRNNNNAPTHSNTDDDYSFDPQFLPSANSKSNDKDSSVGTTTTTDHHATSNQFLVGAKDIATDHHANYSKLLDIQSGGTLLKIGDAIHTQKLSHNSRATMRWLDIRHFLSKSMLTNGSAVLEEKAMKKGSELLLRQEKQIIPYVIKKGKKHNPAPTSYLNGMEGAIVLHNKTKKKKNVDRVSLDPRDIVMWKLTKNNNIGEEKEKEEEEADAYDEKWWANERETFLQRISAFNATMNLILGNRRFSPWKGSVVDSVVGVYLTQNVTDILSSNAYMTLASSFPPQETKNHTENDEVQWTQRNNRYYLGDDSMMESKKTDELVLSSYESLLGSLKKLSLDDESDKENPGDLNNEQNTKKSQWKAKNSKKMKEEKEIDWDSLREKWESMRISYSSNSNSSSGEATTTTATSIDHMDSLDWEAVRCAEHKKVATAIQDRGQQNIIAARIQNFLNRTAKIHGSLDLEWLRRAPPNKVEEYLRDIDGLGLKSVECIRLLSLQQVAFPVDVNVGRIAVRIGWVPLEPLPEEVEMHLLETFPMMDSIQKYLWPRLNSLDPRTLYELHYQLITFGKVFCTKRSPNCNACPLRAECRHYASKYGSSLQALPGVSEKNIVSTMVPENTFEDSTQGMNPGSLLHIESNDPCSEPCSEPIIEVPQSPEHEPVNDDDESQCPDIEDFVDSNFDDDVPVIKISSMDNNSTRALVPLNVKQASVPVPKLKHVERLRTEHQTYELPDSHPLLHQLQLEKREPNDVCPYLLCIKSPGETPPNTRCEYQKMKKLCSEGSCSSCDIVREGNSGTVRGTILIPCRTAMRGRFPLNGTYFQVNEVFADHESSHNPIVVPREWIWDLPRRTTYFGTTTQSIFRGLAMEYIKCCFREGFICVRGFNRKTRAPQQLVDRLHITTQAAKAKANKNTNQPQKNSNSPPKL